MKAYGVAGEIDTNVVFVAWLDGTPRREVCAGRLDGVGKKRWVPKFDDPKTLAQIDAVFVTVEPKRGSQHPSGKPLLFASLKMEPNHP